MIRDDVGEERKVEVHFRANDTRSEHDGEPYTWHATGVPFSRAVEWVERVRAGKQLDPLGRPWKNVDAWLVF